MQDKRLINLVDARNMRQETQSKVAESVGLSLSMYAQIEQGNKHASDDAKRRIANYLGYNIGFLFFNEPITKSNNKEF